ncbi:MAG: uracil-DNA glycosylase [Gemmatimonadota bacterium]|nr:MAG: uracil-DNA glycosylase [Gemmatimonadota bacterium]
MTSLKALLEEIGACRICEAHLPHGPRPVVRADRRATILIVGQAPGRRVHESGIPFDDPSGDRLRDWMGVDRDTFYDVRRVAIVPMGFCFPGTGTSGDLPPREECAPAWREPLLAKLPNVQLTLVIGQYAQAYHLPGKRRPVTEVVRGWKEHWPDVIPLPHPSPRNIRWFTKNPWFEAEVLPAVRKRVAALL